jgi:hypothetical protein
VDTNIRPKTAYEQGEQAALEGLPTSANKLSGPSAVLWDHGYKDALIAKKKALEEALAVLA